MTRVSSLILFSALTIALASPALAKTTIQKGENLCKAEIAKLQPAPKSVRVDKEGAKASNATFVFDVKVKHSDDTAAKLLCTVDRESQAVSIAATN
jgi:carbon monoxide dehydrogenase subunit G